MKSELEKEKQHKHGEQVFVDNLNGVEDDDTAKLAVKQSQFMKKWRHFCIVISVIGGLTLVLIIIFVIIKCCGKDDSMLTEENIKRLSFSSYEDTPLLKQIECKQNLDRDINESSHDYDLNI